MVETNREKAIEQAVYVGTQEKTRYFARRIARTELARAWHEGFIAKYNQDDDIVAYKWKLSSSHLVFDICDFYANADLYGLGKGVYPKNKVPILPAHPHCMCRLMPIVKGMIDNDEPKDNIEQGGRDYIESLTDIEKKQLLGVKATNKFSNGESWQKYLRNYKTDTFKNRISIEKSKNKTYNEPIKRLNLETASVHDVINHGKLINEKYKIHEHVGDIDRLKEILSKFTTLTTEIPKDIWAAKNIKANMEVLSDAFKCYPKAWLDYLKDNKVKLYTRKDKRGFFTRGAAYGSYYDLDVDGDYEKDYATINFDANSEKAFNTALHEIGHLVEHFDPHILRLSKEFLGYRTKGEPLRSLNDIFDNRSKFDENEIARADNFISPYIGKDYDDATEVLSMGLDAFFTNRQYEKRFIYDNQLNRYVLEKRKITDDVEYLNFIIGIIFNV